MSTDIPLAFSSDVESADWIRPRLRPFEQFRATSIVPDGFDAYARILHPAQLPADGRQLVRWSEVAGWSDTPMSDRVQWHDISLPKIKPSSEPPWRGQGPSEGSPYVADVDALIDDLADYTSGSERIFFCVWVGYLGGGAAVFTPVGSPPVYLPQRIPPERVVALPLREYGLIEAPLSFATSLDAASDGSHKTANLWWPEDRAWCVASEIDLRWTYVGGSRELIERVLGDQRLEALPVTPEDPSCLVVSGWLCDLIETATDELMAKGSLKLVLALGSVEMTWRDEKLQRRFVISSNTSGHSGSGSSTSPVRTRDRTFLRSEMRREVQRAVLQLT
jgi:hypothetical protein